jgi:hypothetical protein
MSSGDILTKRDVAELLKVSERWMSEGAIPYAPLPKRGAWSEVQFFRSSGCGSATSSRSACLVGW